MSKQVTILVTSFKGKQLVGLPHSRSSFDESTCIDHWKDRFDKFNLYCYRPINRIAPNEKYVVYVKVYRDFLSSRCNKMFTFYKDNELGMPVYPMPKRVWEDSRKGQVHWLIDYATECEQLNKQVNINTTQLLQSFNTTAANVTLITGAASSGPAGNLLLDDLSAAENYNVVTGYQLFDFVNLDGQLKYVQEKISLIMSKTVMPYKSLCYNRLPRQHRTVIVAHIMNKNYEDQTLFSLGTFANNPQKSRWFDWRSYFPEYEKQFKILETAGDIYPSIEESNADLQVNLAATTGWIHGVNSSFQFVTETNSPMAPYPFLTEKTLKACAMLQPFIQCGPMNNMKFLKEFGYNTFDTYINHSYDSEPDDVKRLRMVLVEFDRLQAISTEQWADMLYDMMEDLLHNAYLVKNPPAKCTESQLVPILMKHCNG